MRSNHAETIKITTFLAGTARVTYLADKRPHCHRIPGKQIQKADNIAAESIVVKTVEIFMGRAACGLYVKRAATE